MKDDHCSYNETQSLKESPKKKHASMGIEPLTCTILVQRSANWVIKPTGSSSLSWFIINPWKADNKIMKIWKSYNYRNCSVKNLLKNYFPAPLYITLYINVVPTSKWLIGCLSMLITYYDGSRDPNLWRSKIWRLSFITTPP